MRMRWDIVLQRQTKNRLNPEITQRKLRSLAKLAEQNPALGFTGTVSKLKEPERGVGSEAGEEVYIYRARITVTHSDTTDPANTDATFQRHILESIQKQVAVDGWTIGADGIIATHQISGVTGSEVEIPLTALMDEGTPRPVFDLPELDDDALATFFSGVYEREPHIRMIHDAMRAYVRSGGEQRSHVLLEGKPACAKTILFERFKKFYEQGAPDGIERVAFIDGPTMSKAGLENWMLELAVTNKLPEIICIEEIEKQHMDNLLTLLSVMGSGYIMKTNARIGRMKQLAKCVIWATCNDKQLLKNFRDGALWSRFTHKLHCRRPSRELMTRIIKDKVANTNGDPRWADAAIDFAYDGMASAVGQSIVDPRAILGLLDGADRLLDGSYQADYLATYSNGCDDDDRRVSSTMAS